jgi:hypothetical protein
MIALVPFFVNNKYWDYMSLKVERYDLASFPDIIAVEVPHRVNPNSVREVEFRRKLTVFDQTVREYSYNCNNHRLRLDKGEKLVWI